VKSCQKVIFAVNVTVVQDKWPL